MGSIRLRKRHAGRTGPLVALVLASVLTGQVHAQSRPSGPILGWVGTVYVRDADLANSVDIAAGLSHSLSLRSDGTLAAWGSHWSYDCTVPDPNAGFTDVDAGMNHSVALRSDGTVVSWFTYCPQPFGDPVPNAGFTAVAAGSYQNLGLRLDGSIVGWGGNDYGECDVPEPNNHFVAVAGGKGFSLGVKADSTVVTWGANNHGVLDVPYPNLDFVAVSAGDYHVLGLKADGSVVAWGSNSHGQCDVPAPNEGFVAVAAGGVFSLGLKGNGTIVAWGANARGQCDVPQPNVGYLAVAAGDLHALAIAADRTVVRWGANHAGQCNVPSPNLGFVGVSTSGGHTLGLKEDGSVVAWGNNDGLQCDVPEPNSGFVKVLAGVDFSLGLKDDGTVVGWGHSERGALDIPAEWQGLYADIALDREVVAGAVPSNSLFGPPPYWGDLDPDFEFCDFAEYSYEKVAVGLYGRGIVALTTYGYAAALVGLYSYDCSEWYFREHAVDVAAGSDFFAAVATDGTLHVWGRCYGSPCDVPVLNENFVKVVASDNVVAGLRNDGSVAAWALGGYQPDFTPPAGELFVDVEVAASSAPYIVLGITPYPIVSAALEYPASLQAYPDQAGVTVFGRVRFDPGLNPPAGEVGYGPHGTDPATAPGWRWSPAALSGYDQEDALYSGALDLTATAPGSYSFCYRFSYENPVYGDLDGSFNGYDPAQAGILSVVDTPDPDVPVIVSVVDVPADQGGEVTVTWHRCANDNLVITPPVVSYSIYRQQEGGALAQADAAAMVPAGWDSVGTVAADASFLYAVPAPTLVDSTVNDGDHLTTFMVRALTATPDLYFDSAPASGRSVDNLPPAVPSHFATDFFPEGVEMSWDAAEEPDFAVFRLYRGDSEDFVPAPANLLVETTATSWTDPTPDPWTLHYKLTAVDLDGNESAPATTPRVVSVGDTGLPGAPVLHEAVPNPFNPATKLTYGVPAACHVRLRIFDVAGRLVRTLVDERVGPGYHTEQWEGRDDGGRAVSSGVYFYRLETGRARETRRMVLVK